MVTGEGKREGRVQALAPLAHPCLSTATDGGGPQGPDPGREAGCCPQGGVAQHFLPNPEPAG